MPKFAPTEDFIIELFCKIDEMKDVKSTTDKGRVCLGR